MFLPLLGCLDCTGDQEKGGKEISETQYVRIIRAGADKYDPTILDKDEFLELMEQVSSERNGQAGADQIEKILFGRDMPNGREAWMQAFRTSYFSGYDLLPLARQLHPVSLSKSDLRLVWEYTSDALKMNRFEFIPASSIEDPENQILFTDKMVNAFGHLYLCLGANQADPQIRGVEVIRLPKPVKTSDGLMYMPGQPLEGKQCIVYVPKPWFGAGSQHKGFYPHDYSVVLNMLLEMARSGDTEFTDMIGYSFDNFKALSETIGHIPNANKSWSMGYTSRTQTNTLVSQVLLYAEYLQQTSGEKAAKQWLRDVGLTIAQNDLAFFIADRARTPQGLYRFVPIGKTPDGHDGDTYTYTPEMHNSPVLHNFYFERLLNDLMTTYEGREDQANFCTAADCLKYIEEISGPDITKKLRPRNLVQLIEERKGPQALSDEDVAKRTEFARRMKGKIFVWDNPIRGEELIAKSSKSGKYYRLTNYALGSDQAMRASGFDPSDVAGPNSLDALDIAYAGHNAQLYRQMLDMAEIYNRLAMDESAQGMIRKATDLKQAILTHMWSPKYGELVPYHQEEGRVDYRFFDMSYALWARLFDISKPRESAILMSVVRNIADFEGPEGPYASTDWSGHNWGWGKVWPVMAAYAFMGLRDYADVLRTQGFTEEARLCDVTAQRITLKWLYSNAEMFAKEFGFGENLAVRKGGEPLENIYGYDIDPKKAGNYTWHVVITRWFYTQLNDESKNLFHTFYATLKKQHPDKL